LGLYDLDRIRAAGIDVVRRPTGGRAILHDREVTYSVTAPLEDAAPLRETYSRINRILQDGLSRLDVTVVPAMSSGRAAVPSGRPCFETPAEGELVAQGGKLVGSVPGRRSVVAAWLHPRQR
jgi:lipoate-protein ligase A